jgi:hypothetical protein
MVVQVHSHMKQAVYTHMHARSAPSCCPTAARHPAKRGLSRPALAPQRQHALHRRGRGMGGSSKSQHVATCDMWLRHLHCLASATRHIARPHKRAMA